MAGKALKDVTEIVKCAGCGRPKRMHLMCPYCMICTSTRARVWFSITDICIAIKQMLAGKEPKRIDRDEDSAKAKAK